MIASNTIVGGRYRVTRPLGGGGMKLVYLAEDLRLASRPCALAEMVDSFHQPRHSEAGGRRVSARGRHARATQQRTYPARVRSLQRAESSLPRDGVYRRDNARRQKLQNAAASSPRARSSTSRCRCSTRSSTCTTSQPPVIYRDLKPSNVMLDAIGQVKLIDFGIARLFQPLSNATMIGTQGYAPPEQYRGKVESRSDLYALGATMHHALSGRDPAVEPPFSFPPLRSLCPDITPALCELVDQALKYDVVLRVADAEEFKAAAARDQVGSADHDAARNSSRGGVASATQAAARRRQGQRAASVAPTMLSNQIDTQCPRCGRSIPVDSNLLLVLRGGRDADDGRRWIAAQSPKRRRSYSRTVASPREFPGPIFHERHRRRRPARSAGAGDRWMFF